MKKDNASQSIKRLQLEKIEKRINEQFENILKIINLMDQKNFNAHRSIEARIISQNLDLYQRLEKGFQAYIQIESREIVEKINEKITKFKDLILTTVDPLLAELETRREDREIAADQSTRISQQLDNFQKRISKLEQKAA